MITCIASINEYSGEYLVPDSERLPTLLQYRSSMSFSLEYSNVKEEVVNTNQYMEIFPYFHRTNTVFSPFHILISFHVWDISSPTTIDCEHQA